MCLIEKGIVPIPDIYLTNYFRRFEFNQEKGPVKCVACYLLVILWVLVRW